MASIPWSIKLFSVRGIPIKIHVTFGLVLLWGAYRWSDTGNSSMSGIAFGIAATLLLFACVTLHELGHAIIAQRYGIKVDDITLFPIGGVARLGSIPGDPRQELAIAVAGPMVNVVLAIVLYGISLGTDLNVITAPGSAFDELERGTWQALIFYLLIANIALVLFNLIPAFPMDGGRILRALLAMRLHYARATRIASLVGQVFAVGFGLYGLYSGNVFLVLVALFVWTGARQEGAAQQQPETTNRTAATPTVTMLANQIMRPPPAVVRQGSQTAEGLSNAFGTAVDLAVVDKDGYMVGLIPAGLLATASPGATLQDLMRRDYLVARPDEPISEVWERLSRAGQPASIVLTDNGQLAGWITAADLVAAIQNRPRTLAPLATALEEPQIEKSML